MHRRIVQPAIGMDTRHNGFLQFRYFRDRVRAGTETLPRNQFVFVGRVSPSRRFQQIGIDGYVGQDVDFENIRRGHGAVGNVSGTINPTNHLVIDLLTNTQWPHPREPSRFFGHPIFTARVWRTKVTYTFRARSFVRLVSQCVETTREPHLFVSSVAARDAQLTGTALFATRSTGNR